MKKKYNQRMSGILLTVSLMVTGIPGTIFAEEDLVNPETLQTAEAAETGETASGESDTIEQPVLQDAAEGPEEDASARTAEETLQQSEIILLPLEESS